LATREPLQEGAHSRDVDSRCQPVCPVFMRALGQSGTSAQKKPRSSGPRL